jgi:hypothetical protein
MKGIIEVGIVLLVVYLFLQWEKQGGAAGPSIGSGSSGNFLENIGSPADGLINESGPSLSPQVSLAGKKTGGCGCGGMS